MRLLQRFSSSLLSAEYPSTADVPHNLRVFSRKVELSLDVLEHLQRSTNYALMGRNTSPVSRKRSKSVTSSRRIDPLPFNSMGISVPSTDAEVHDVYIRVLSQLRTILEVRGFIADSLHIELKTAPALSPHSQEAYTITSFQIRIHECKPIVGRRARSVSGPSVSHGSVDEGRTILRQN